MSDERRYDEREVGLILKRVAELHEREGEKADTRAMTRAEIEDVVTDLGISRSLVARAASEVSLRDVRNRMVWWLGGKTDTMFEDVVEGPIDDVAMSRSIEVLRRYLGDPGELQHDAGARIWTTKDSSRRIYLTVVQHDNTTTVRLEERMADGAGATVGMATFAGGFGAFLTVIPLKALLLKPMLLLVWPPLVFVGAMMGWLAGRAVWKRRSAARELELRRAFAEIVEIAATQPDAPALPPGDEAP